MNSGPYGPIYSIVTHIMMIMIMNIMKINLEICGNVFLLNILALAAVGHHMLQAYREGDGRLCSPDNIIVLVF